MISIHTLFLSFDESLPWPSYLNYLSSQKRQRLLRFRNEQDRTRSIAAETLARTVLSGDSMNFADLDIAIDAYGKPYLPESGLHFNVSHSGSWAAVAVSNEPVGIDIEQIRPIEWQGIARQHFAGEELRALQCETEESRLSTFFTLWTAKESFVKAEGRGLSVPLQSFCVNRRDNTVCESGRSAQRLGYWRSYQVSRDYVLSVSARSATFPDRTIIWNESDLLSGKLRNEGNIEM